MPAHSSRGHTAATPHGHRHILSSQLQAPYLDQLQKALGESEQRVLFFIDVAIGTLLHRMGMTGEPMVAEDVDALVAMFLRELG
ncbi:hypothetical protein [Kribbella sp. NPDC055071]